MKICESKSLVNFGFITLDAKKGCHGSPLQHLMFSEECKKFITAFLQKFQMKTPLNYSLVRNSDCLDPSVMITKDNDSLERKMRHLIQIFITNRVIAVENGDHVLREFRKFLRDASILSELTKAAQLSESEKDLDDLFFRLLSSDVDFSNLL